MMTAALILLDTDCLIQNIVYEIKKNLLPSVDTFLRARIIPQRSSLSAKIAIMMQFFCSLFCKIDKIFIYSDSAITMQDQSSNFLLWFYCSYGMQQTQVDRLRSLYILHLECLEKALVVGLSIQNQKPRTRRKDAAFDFHRSPSRLHQLCLCRRPCRFQGLLRI